MGLPRETVDHIWGADRDEQTGALAMLDALWPATLGYFMRQMMAPNVTPGMAEELRRWARANLRGRGPYPAFRVGPAPYGLLPVGPLSAWRVPVEGVRQELPQGFQRLVPLWLAASQGAPRVGRSADPEADLVGVLAMDASMQTAQIRRATGYEATWNIWGFHGLNLRTFEQLRSSIGRELLQMLGAPSWDPRVLRLNFAEKAYDFSGPLIEDRPLSETERLAFNYIAWLRTASIADLQKQGAPPADPPVNALLYLMLRHALLSEYDASAQHVLQSQGLLAAEELREAELIAVVPPGQGQPVQRTAWDRFGVKIAGVTGDRTLGELIADPGAVSPAAPPPLQQAFGDVAAYRGALERLENLPTAELHRLFGETLDLTSHRLDAWLVGLFDERLREMRANNPEGLYIGCYGWVEDLRPDPPLPRVPITAPDGAPAEARTDSDGYVLAPSMLQARRRRRAAERLPLALRSGARRLRHRPVVAPRAHRPLARRHRARGAAPRRGAWLSVRARPARGPSGRRARSVHRRAAGALPSDGEQGGGFRRARGVGRGAQRGRRPPAAQGVAREQDPVRRRRAARDGRGASAPRSTPSSARSTTRSTPSATS